jgi:hypothetical protein
MKSFVTGLALVAAMLVSAMAASGQDQEAKAQGKTNAAPGPIHRELAKRAGEYTTHSKFTFKPGAPPQETEGTAALKSILGGRFLQEDNTGKLIGMPVGSMHLYGYNNATKKYESIWMYTGSTGFMTMSGTSDDGGKTIKYVATFDDDAGNKQTLEVFVRNIDDDHFSVALIAKNPEGGQGPTLETTYARKK